MGDGEAELLNGFEFSINGTLGCLRLMMELLTVLQTITVSLTPRLLLIGPPILKIISTQLV
jgi:hypothetical protein